MWDCLELPETGFETWSLALIGCVAIIVGVVLWRLGRRGVGTAAVIIVLLAFATASRTPVFAADDCLPAPVPPVAVADTATVDAGGWVTIAVLANDSGDGPGIVGTTAPMNGTITIGVIGSITYTANPGFEGVDTFTYTIQDATGLTATATVTVTVTKPFPITVSPTSLDFGDIVVGAVSAPRDVIVKNISATTQTITAIGGGGGNFPGTTTCGSGTIDLDAGATCVFSYSFTPTAVGPDNGSTSIQLTANSTTRTYPVSLTGNGLSPITVSPTALAFGDVFLGQTRQLNVVIKNVSPVAQTFNIAGGYLSAVDTFDALTSCFGGTIDLAPGATCVFNYSFTPADYGPATADTAIQVTAAGATQDYPITLTGNGASPIAISPLNLDFGDVAVGDTSLPQKVVVTNISTVEQTINSSGGGLASTSKFDATSTCGGPTITLSPGATCVLTYSFTPTNVGPANDDTEIGITLYVDSVEAPYQGTPITLSGNGVTPGP